MATQIANLQELNRFYLRTCLCGLPDWKVLCGPESVNTLTWQFQRDRIHVDPNYTDGLVQIVSTCGKQCDGCNMEVVDLSRLIRGLQFIPLDQAIA